MRKFALATVLALAAVSASAVEVGVVGGTDFLDNGANRGTAGLTISQHYGPVSAIVEGLRETHNNTNKYNLLAGYDVTKIGTATLTVKAGVSYIDNSAITQHSDRYAGVIGAGVTIPVTNHIAATVDYRFTDTKDNVTGFQGNTVLVGARYAF